MDDVFIAMTSGYREVPIYVTLIPDALNGEGDSIRETLSDKVIPNKKGSKTHRDNIHYRGDAFWVILMLDKENELDTREVDYIGKAYTDRPKYPDKESKVQKTHRDSLRYRRNIFRVVSILDGKNAIEGGSIGETIAIGSKGNTLLRRPMK